MVRKNLVRGKAVRNQRSPLERKCEAKGGLAKKKGEALGSLGRMGSLLTSNYGEKAGLSTVGEGGKKRAFNNKVF